MYTVTKAFVERNDAGLDLFRIHKPSPWLVHAVNAGCNGVLTAGFDTEAEAVDFGVKHEAKKESA